jgi:hypothetical protein
VHKIPNTSIKSSDITQACNTSLEKMTGRPIGLVSTGKGKFPEESSSEPCKWVRWSRDVLESGCSGSRGCRVLLVDAFVEVELHLSWMQIFPSPCLYSFILLLLFLQEVNQGTLPLHGDSVTHKYFCRNEKVGS